MSGRLRSTLAVLGFGFGAFVAEAIYSGNERFYREVVCPTLHTLVPDGERAHSLAIIALRYGLTPRRQRHQFPDLEMTVFGLRFDHPFGMAAGFDKNGEAVVPLLDSGFSHVEVGTVTPLPQAGNPQPRIFRWKEQSAVVNRCGFNNDGHDAVYERLKSRPWEGRGVVGVNLGCNKTSLDKISDYVSGVEKFGNVADYLVINVSSPNTPGLREMQRKDSLARLLTNVLDARSKLNKRTPILLKISPDETDAHLKELVEVCISPATRVDGLIVSNTAAVTSHADAVACGAADPSSPTGPLSWGGVSGPPLLERSTECLRRVSRLTKGTELVLIGVGGVSDPADAVRKLEAGATLIQLYTSCIYQGTPVAHRLARGIQQSSPCVLK